MEEVQMEVSAEVLPNKNKRTIWTVIGIVAVVGFFILMIVLMAGGGGGEQKEDFTLVSSKMTTEYSEYLGYSANITGVVKNVSGEDYSYVSIEFSVYDANGNNIGTARDSMNNLADGESWTFDASLWDFPETKPVSYKFIEITAW